MAGPICHQPDAYRKSQVWIIKMTLQKVGIIGHHQIILVFS